MKQKLNYEERRKNSVVESVLVDQFKRAIKAESGESGEIAINFSINCIPEDTREFFKKRLELWEGFQYSGEHNGVKKHFYCSNFTVNWDRVTVRLEKIE